MVDHLAHTSTMNNQGLDALAALAAAASHSSNHKAQSGNENGKDSNGLGTQSNDVVVTTPPIDSNVPGIATQQWHQAIANAAASLNVLSAGGSNQNNNLALLGMQQLVQGQTPPPPATTAAAAASAANPSLLAIQQQLALQQQLSYYQLLAHAASQQQQQHQRQFGASNPSAIISPTAAAATAQISQILGVNNQASFQNTGINAAATSPITSTSVTSPTATLQAASATVPLLTVNNNAPTHGLVPTTYGYHMQVPQQPTPTTTTSLAAIAPHQQKHQQHRSASSGGQDWSDDDNHDDNEYYSGDKRQLKRVANRKSAQLSRKRKKQFIEELKDENDGLRRKEQILRSIPDLVVVFDSSGKLWFVSESVSRFLDFKATELEGTSFWNRLCDDSVRLLKAAFMDSLAARQNDAETASLGSGIWELRLVDKNGSHKVVTLHGVVHFAGDRPECVCSIRPHDESMSVNRSEAATVRHESYVSASTSSAGSVTSNSMKRHRKSAPSSMLNIKQSQSVVTNSVASPNNKNERSSSSSRGGSTNGAVRISDSGNSSGSSDSGSGDELVTNEIAA